MLLTHRVAVVDATRWRAFLIFVVAAPANSTEALARFVLRLLHRVGRGSRVAAVPEYWFTRPTRCEPVHDAPIGETESVKPKRVESRLYVRFF